MEDEKIIEHARERIIQRGTKLKEIRQVLKERKTF